MKPLMCVQDTLRRAEQLQLLEGVLVWQISTEGEQGLKAGMSVCVGAVKNTGSCLLTVVCGE